LAQGAPSQVLVVGGDGLVGRHLAEILRAQGHSVVATSRRPGAGTLALDLAAPPLDALAGRGFSHAFICAAVTSLQACEAAPEATRRANVEGTLALMRRLAADGSHLVFFSSSQVFDGEIPLPDEAAPTAPKNAYGRQKREVEEAVAAEGLPAAVIRIPKILARHPVGVFRGWYDSLRRGEPATAATNMPISAVSVDWVVEGAMRLGFGRHTGIWHLSSADEMPYYAAALLMAEICGLPRDLVQGRELADAQVPAIFRHRFAALDAGKFAGAFHAPPPATRAVLTTLFSAFD
jgi:dTDP-4-dehydrorhamnose reductase